MDKDNLFVTIQMEIVMGIYNEFQMGNIPIDLFDEQSEVKAEIKKRIIKNFYWLLEVYQQFGGNIRRILPEKFKKTATKKIKAHYVFSESELDELAIACYDELIEDYSDEIKQFLYGQSMHVEEEIVIRAKINEKGFEISSVQTIGKIVSDFKVAEKEVEYR